MAKIVCFTNKNDSEELIQKNIFGLELDFFDSFEKLPESDFYIVSLKYGSKIYNDFIKFMRARPKSRFIFLEEYTTTLDDEDFNIRDEENTEPFMYVPSAALKRIKYLIDYEIEHSDAVMVSTHSFESWLDLIIWDLLEIQEASNKFNETFFDKELQHFFDILKNDIEILENHTEDEPKVFFLEYSNNTMVKLVGYIYETTELLRGAEFFKILEPIKKIEEAINEFITFTGNNLNGFNWAWEKWNSLSKDQKDELLYDLPIITEKGDGKI
jgi:hypothetical protein